MFLAGTQIDGDSHPLTLSRPLAITSIGGEVRGFRLTSRRFRYRSSATERKGHRDVGSIH